MCPHRYPSRCYRYHYNFNPRIFCDSEIIAYHIVFFKDKILIKEGEYYEDQKQH